MTRFAITCSSRTVPWADEDARKRQQTELERHGEIRFFGLAGDTAELLLIVEAVDQSEAFTRGEAAAKDAFGRNYQWGGCTPVIDQVDPFPHHPATAAS